MWGRGDSGELGNNGLANFSSPIQIGSLTNWSKVSCSNSFTVSIKTDGTLWSWGLGTDGRLGLGNTTTYSSPKQIGLLTNWSKVETNNSYVISLKTDGTLWAWGYNTFGNLGLGNIADYSSPKQIGSLTNWSKIGQAKNGYSSSAIKTDGTLWMWGLNGIGQLGLGDTTSRSSPTQVGALTKWLDVSSGIYHTISVLTP
jgi:hypothetical protein